ncbi:MAG TPA: S8 family serine peptidase, partial [Gemmatimonadales bacterium]
MGAALRRPLADIVVLRRERGRSGTFVDVFVSLSERSPAVIEALGGRVTTRAGSLFGARVPLSGLRALVADSRVRYVKAARRVKPNNDLAMQDIRANLVRFQSNGIFTGATGSNVIVGTFDTGIDWSHPDFKHPDGTTRILYIWDVTTTGAPPGNVGGQVFDHGNECSAALINVGACSERDVAAHGSHVAGIAAGDGSGGSPYKYTGVAPNADIIAVKGGDAGFSFEDVVTGIEYIFKRADILGRPAVVNLSLGSDFGAHDGTEPEEQAIDSLVGPGHIVVIAAGNSGSNPTAVTGNSPISYLHATRTLITGDTAQLGVTVPAYTAASGSLNDYMVFTMWYDARDSLTITVRRPDGTTFARNTGDSAADDEASGGHIYIDNASEGAAPQNGDRQAEIEMYDNDPTHPPALGMWVITIRLDRLGGSGRFDVWEYAASSTLAGSQISGGGDNAYVVNAPGNAARAITVAAHVNRVSWTAQAGNYQYVVREQVGDLATFSSSGPTRPVRDSLPSRQKPDLSAPGKGVFSVYSSASSPSAPGALLATDGVHVLFSGTSMSSPMVTGSVALLLERKPDLTPEQVRAILNGSARQDGFTGVSYAGFGGGVPNPSWGFGKLDVQAALALVPLNLTATKGPRGDSLGGRFVLPRANIPSIQLRIVGDSINDIRVTGITLESTGSGNEPAAVTAVHLYADGDSNGVVGPGDVLLGNATVTQDEGAAVLGGLSYVVAHRTTGYLLGTYDLNGTPRQGDTFRLSLLASSSVTAQRVSDGAAVSLSGGRVTGSAVVVQLIGSVAAASGGGLVSPIAALGGPNAVLLRVDATAASPETVSVRRLVGRFGGTANPAATLENVRLVRDANDNGVVDAGDPVESVLAPAVAGSALAVDLSAPGDPRLPTGITRHWLVVAGIKAGAVESTTVSFTLDSLRGLGVVTDSAVVATGPPLS